VEYRWVGTSWRALVSVSSLWIIEQKLALSKESVLPVLELLYLRKKGFIAMNEALKKEAEAKNSSNNKMWI
jgi:hypothetical protein